jgi:hypothetical protein
MDALKKGDSFIARIKERWLLLLFALPFAGGGVAVLMFSVMPDLMAWHQVKNWEPGQAQLMAGGYKSYRGDDSTSYKAYARYRYTYQGQEYRGDRVAINTGSDNLGDFQRDLGRSLERAHKNGHPVTLWINPDDPRQAILNRELRLGLLAFGLIFSLLFGGVGIGLGLFALLVPLDKLPVAASAAEPWKSHRPWASASIHCDGITGLWSAWGFAVFWCLIAFPAGVMVVLEFQKGNGPALLGLVFPLVGIACWQEVFITLYRGDASGKLCCKWTPIPVLSAGRWVAP